VRPLPGRGREAVERVAGRDAPGREVVAAVPEDRRLELELERGGRLVARGGGLVVPRVENEGARGLVSGAGAPAEGGLLPRLLACLFVRRAPVPFVPFVVAVPLVLLGTTRLGPPLFESLRGWSSSASSPSCLRLRLIVVDTDDVVFGTDVKGAGARLSTIVVVVSTSEVVVAVVLRPGLRMRVGRRGRRDIVGAEEFGFDGSPQTRRPRDRVKEMQWAQSGCHDALKLRL
jgi:hypothetical protein